jgi:hypothetical protein
MDMMDTTMENDPQRIFLNIILTKDLLMQRLVMVMDMAMDLAMVMAMDLAMVMDMGLALLDMVMAMVMAMVMVMVMVMDMVVIINLSCNVNGDVTVLMIVFAKYYKTPYSSILRQIKTRIIECIIDKRFKNILTHWV